MEKFENLNGLRSIACIGIIFMHILANIDYELANQSIVTIIRTFTNFTLLFMVISSFSMCCGYYEKIKNNKLNIESFYSKRIKRILPFFLLLIIADIIVSHNVQSLIEGFTDFTLMFNFLQKDIEVIGVGWFLGLIFVFYMIFPYFVYLFSNKKRAWVITIISFFMNLVSIHYFHVERCSLFYSFIYFCIGGIIYLYRNDFITILKNKYLFKIIPLLAILFYYFFPIKPLFSIQMIFICSTLIIYAISFPSKILNNNIFSFINNISMEMYLSHMFVFRIIEKLKLTQIFRNNYLSYIFASLSTIIFVIFISYFYKVIEKRLFILKGKI